MELFTLVNGKMERNKEKENKYGLMDQYMKGSGKIIEQMELVD